MLTSTRSDGRDRSSHKVYEKYYPDCLAAALCGSVARGEATPTSDLDILIVVSQEIPFYRKSFHDYGWVIEALVGSKKYNEEKIQRPHTNHTPSFLTSWAESIILKDQDNFARGLKEKAIAILEHGPDPLTQKEIDQYRDVITDWLDDLIDSESYEEAVFTAYELVAKAAELLLAYNKQWIGEKKSLYRALQKSGIPMANQLIAALAYFYRSEKKDRLIKIIGSILEMTVKMNDLRLIPIDIDGTPHEDVGQLSQQAKDVCAQTASLYRSVGFNPPWVGYLALQDSQLVGTCAFTGAPEDGRVEIAYFTFPQFEGRGVATSMAKQLIEIVIASHAQVLVFAQTLPVDNASNSILKKLGFVFAGVVPHAEEGNVWEWHREVSP